MEQKEKIYLTLLDERRESFSLFVSFSFRGMRWHCYDRLRAEYIMIILSGK